MPHQTWSGNRQFHNLRIDDHIDDVPRPTRLFRSKNGPQALEGPFFSMHLYRIHGSGFQVLDQDNAANPAIPPLFAPAKQSAFQTHRSGRNHGHDRLADDEMPFFSFCPSDAEIGARPDVDPHAGSNEADIVRTDQSSPNS